MTLGQLSVTGLSKSFGPTQALDDVSFAVRGGTVHALVGENGAGKSTLLKIISGIYRADSGDVQIDGDTLPPGSPLAAQNAGIQIVHQELALMSDLTVTQNIYAGQHLRRHGVLDQNAMERGARDVLSRLGADVDVRRRVDGLSTANQQLVELARSLVRSSRVLILDEPTAALPPEDAKRLHEILRALAAEGVGIAYVSHRLDEVLAVADEVTILKDGKVVASRPAAGLTSEAMVSLMVGRPLQDLFPGRNEPEGRRRQADLVLSVRGLIALPAVHGVDLDVAAGEIVGLYGLEGAGQDDLLGCIAGDRSRTAGEVVVASRPVRRRGVAAAIKRGIGFVPPDRKQQGLILDAPGVQNISLPVLRQRFTKALFVNVGAEVGVCEDAGRDAGVVGDLTRPVVTLSGGNQQKILLARLLLAGSPVLLLNQPTRGVDVGAKADIYNLIRGACDQGRGALIVSPEINELLGLCDRILVIREGHIAGNVKVNEATEESILATAVPA